MQTYYSVSHPPLVLSEASDASTATTTSSTDAVLTSMTITPPTPGTYHVSFASSVTSATSGAAISFSVYVGGSQNGTSLIKVIPFSGGTLTSGSARGAVACLAVATVNGSQAIAIEWSTSGGTATCGPRTLTVMGPF